MWCVGSLDDEYIDRMENILDLYTRKCNPKRPVFCVDEKPFQLFDNKYSPIPAGKKRGSKTQKIDYEYIRKGTASIFVAVSPKLGKRITYVRNRRTRKDFAQFMRMLERYCPNAEKIHVVLDNLNTHNIKSLIVRYGQKEGHRIWNTGLLGLHLRV